jgi:hypothetical protein
VDPGSTHSIVKRSFVKGISNKRLKKNKTSYLVAGGTYSTDFEVKLGISLPEFNPNSIVRHRFAIDDSDDGGIGYDMIIGQDLCWNMGIVVDYDDAMIEWNGMSIPMKDEDFPCRKGLRSKREMRQMVARTAEPRVTQEATSRILKILDSDYKKADLEAVVARATQLSASQQQKLLKLLRKYEDLFDGTLGKWNTDPVDIELRADSKPVSSRYYPVPRINKETFKKELMRLVAIGVLTPVQQSEWGTPVFIIPKKDGTVRFITDYRKVNRMIKRMPYRPKPPILIGPCLIADGIVWGIPAHDSPDL